MVSLLMRRLKLQRVLVFTHSTESVHRLLEFFGILMDLDDGLHIAF